MVLMKRWSIIRCRMSTCCYLQFTTDNNVNKIFIKSILVFDIYILKPKSWLIKASRSLVQNSYVCKLWYTERKKLSHFDIKSWVTCGTKIQPGKVGNWRIFESNKLNIESLIGSTLRVKLAQHWESSWLNIESQVDSTLRVKLTQHWESNWLKYSPVTYFAWWNYNSAKMTLFFISVHWKKKLRQFDLKSWVKF